MCGTEHQLESIYCLVIIFKLKYNVVLNSTAIFLLNYCLTKTLKRVFLRYNAIQINFQIRVVNLDTQPY